MRRGITVLILLGALSVVLKSQNETINWYFGNSAGISFSVEPPTVLTGSTIPVGWSCGSSMSDGAGNLLFYTKGTLVYNSQHNVMANSNGMYGGGSSEQSGLAVKQPGNSSNYYVFTTSGTTPSGGLYYSVIDISLAAGLGSVTVKNAPLLTPGTEKVAAVRHCNGVDSWIISHQNSSNNFVAYLLTASGINTVPIISAAGTSYTSFASPINPNYTYSPMGDGPLKISPWGNKIAVALPDTMISRFELYDFDNNTGQVSNAINLGPCYPRSCEFSPDGSKLYGSALVSQSGYGGRYLFQWDLCAGSPAAIVASRDTISTPTNTNYTSLYLQLGPNGKIYVSNAMKVLGCINNPNNPGNACNYVDSAIYLPTANLAYIGLPGYEVNLLRPKFSYSTETNCSNVSFTVPPFAACAGYSVTSYLWSFGDPASGTANTSTLTNPAHHFTNGGSHTVKLVVNYSTCAADTFVKIINHPATPILTVTGKQSICTNNSTTLTVTGADSYSWSGGANTNSIVLSPTNTSTYTVTGTFTNNTCISNKTVTVSVSPCLSIFEETGFNDLVKVYPNPAKDQFTIETDLSNAQINIYNQIGDLIYQGATQTGITTIDLKEKGAGIYFVELNHPQTQRVFKLVKTE
jgi:hypothetical protein